MQNAPQSLISLKAEELYQTITSITDLIPEDNGMLQEIKS